MFLLNNQEIRERLDDPTGAYLDIANFDASFLQHTFYYFRLGSEYEIQVSDEFQTHRLTGEKPVLTLEPNGYAVVKSHETFKLSDKVMAVLGPSSDFVRSGLELVHSPFIDPLFHGQLEMGLRNRLSKRVNLRLGHRIGKIAFFDVSDSRPIQLIEGSVVEHKFKSRRPLRDDEPVPVWVEEDDPEEA